MHKVLWEYREEGQPQDSVICTFYSVWKNTVLDMGTVKCNRHRTNIFYLIDTRRFTFLSFVLWLCYENSNISKMGSS